MHATKNTHQKKYNYSAGMKNSRIIHEIDYSGIIGLVCIVICSTTKASSKAKENLNNTLEKHNEECAIIAHSHCLVFMTSFNCDMSSTIQALHIRLSWLYTHCPLDNVQYI